MNDEELQQLIWEQLREFVTGTHAVPANFTDVDDPGFDELFAPLKLLVRGLASTTRQALGPPMPPEGWHFGSLAPDISPDGEGIKFRAAIIQDHPQDEVIEAWDTEPWKAFRLACEQANPSPNPS